MKELEKELEKSFKPLKELKNYATQRSIQENKD
jgi:hypothetical protein